MRAGCLICPESTVEAKIRALSANYVRLIEANDVPGVQALMSEDGTIMPDGAQAYRGKGGKLQLPAFGCLPP